MKRYTSRFFKSVALIYMAFPIAYVTLAGLVFNMPMASCVRLLLSPFYYLVSVLAVLAGYGIWEMYRWGWYLFVFSNVLITYQTALVMNQYSETHHKLLGFILSLIWISGLTFRLAREVRVPYFSPRIRWWESNPRYRLAVPADILRKVSEQSVSGEILDLSMSGCFIKLRTDLKTDEPVKLRFEVFRLPIEVEGVIVWKSESTVTHPKGVGVKFSAVDRHSKRALRLVSKRLRAISNFYRTSRYLLSQEDFLKGLEEIESRDFAKKKKVSATENVS